MIKRFAVNKLSGVWDIDFNLHPDINVLTGRNGAGKTTVLKLLWFMTSGNIERIVPEITFESAEVETDAFTLRLKVVPKEQYPLLQVELEFAGKEAIKRNIPCRHVFGSNDLFDKTDSEVAEASGGSVFFPTFRRIEGGFSTSSSTLLGRVRRSSALQDAMTELTDELSYKKHHFVSAISTNDIVQLLTRQLAEKSKTANELQADLSNLIERTIKEFDQKENVAATETLEAATRVIDTIRKAVRNIEGKREILFMPNTVLNRLVGELLRPKGIRVKDVATFGDVSSAIEAGHLSAGEKQMLSFLCYNAFSRESTIFIDEPEISLHVDWQRVLFPKLLEQGVGNQFIVATHSPFIYTKFADREHRLDVLGHADE